MPTTTKPTPSPEQPPPNRLLYGVVGVLLAVLLVGLGSFLWLDTGPGNPAGIGGPFTLTDGDGKTVTDRDFRGKFMLVYFGYTFCPDVCPTTLNEVADAMDKLGPQADRVQPLFITVDPERDTPAVVKPIRRCVQPAHHRADRHAGADRRGGEGIPRLLRRASHRAGAGNDYSMDHSSILYLMGPDGQFVAPIRADQQPREMAAELKKLIG